MNAFSKKHLIGLLRNYFHFQQLNQNHSRMIFAHNPRSKDLSAEIIKDRIVKTENEIRRILVSKLNDESSHYSVTVDHWTSASNQTYAGMTVHFIDKKFELCSLTLGCFLHVGETKSEDALHDFAFRLIRDSNLDYRKMTAIATDTTANMNKFGELCEKENIPHVHCIDHVLQLTAVKAFKDENYDNHSLDVTTVANNSQFINPPIQKSCLMKKVRSIV